MADIDKELNQIKDAVYGREVRGSIHDGIDKINKETEKATEKANEAYEITENLLDESFDSAIIEQNFEQRLDDEIKNLQPEWTGFKEDVTSQLAQKADNDDFEELSLKVKQMMRKVTVDDLPEEGIVSAHRGGGRYDRAPVGADNGFSGFDMAIRLGAHIIDVDARRTGDGTFIAMHDESVARTTDGRGYVTSLVSSALPNIDITDVMGYGWSKEPIPTIEEILIKYGGKVIITIEPKDGLSAIKPLADLIKSYKLERSVFINTNKVEEIEEIIAQGCLAHAYGQKNKEDALASVDAGAWLINVPYNASEEFVEAVLDSSANRVIASSIGTYEQAMNITAGIQGHVSDAMGMTNRKKDSKRIVDTIKGSLLANKRGIGWRYFGDWTIKENKLIYLTEDDGPGTEGTVYLGDLSGEPSDNYSITFKFTADEQIVDTGSFVRLKFCSTSSDGDGLSATTDGYVASIKGDGDFELKETASGTTNALDNKGTEKLVAGKEYKFIISVTPTSIQVVRDDTNDTLSANNDLYRGGNIYLWMNRNATNSAFTDVRIEED